MSTANFACVYLCYDADDNPLYIGSSRRMHQRLISHVDSVFWPQVSRIEILRVADYGDALDLEADLIALHQPQFNVAGVVELSPAERRDARSAAHARGDICNWHNCRQCRAKAAV
jgi:predicted GIY-YIG superfamily endonuclease